MPAYSLGSFQFHEANVEGQPGAPPPWTAQEREVFAYPGVDGIAVRNNGFKGIPFNYRTCGYKDGIFATTAQGLQLQQLYALARNQVAQNLVWEGNDYDDINTRFMVLDVGQFQLQKVSGLIIDGSVIGAAMLVYATWTLIPVDF